MTTMSDKEKIELLKNAAKARGWADKRVDERGVIAMEAGYDAEPCIWNPLTDDEAAFQLMTFVGMRVETDHDDGSVVAGRRDGTTPMFCVEYTNNEEKKDATRRAIVECAAWYGYNGARQ